MLEETNPSVLIKIQRASLGLILWLLPNDTALPCLTATDLIEHIGGLCEVLVEFFLINIFETTGLTRCKPEVAEGKVEVFLNIVFDFTAVEVELAGELELCQDSLCNTCVGISML